MRSKYNPNLTLDVSYELYQKPSHRYQATAYRLVGIYGSRCQAEDAEEYIFNNYDDKIVTKIETKVRVI